MRNPTTFLKEKQGKIANTDSSISVHEETVKQNIYGTSDG